MYTEQQYLFALLSLEQIGPKRIKELLNAFEFNASHAWNYLCSPETSKKSPFLNKLYRQAISIQIDAVAKQITNCEYDFVTLVDHNYPQLLKEISDPPPILYYRGVLPKQSNGITIVGSRKMSRYGQSVIKELISPLTQAGIPIYSGLAYGVDIEAHRNALQYHAPTIAVLGSGIDQIRPVHHSLVAEEIVDSGGCILSELRPGLDAVKGTFPKRNRVLAGLTSMTLIIEAAEQSGALITARYALDYDREVCVIPGSIFSPVSRGCHQLLKQGATLIQSSQDLFDLLKIKQTEQNNNASEIKVDAELAIVYNLLDEEPKPIDEIIQMFNGHSAELFQILTKLELQQLISHIPGEGYKIRTS